MRQLISKTELIQVATYCFFSISAIEIVGEFRNSDFIISLSKPLLLPLLIFIYSLSSNKTSKIYLLALVLNWIANVLFLSVISDLIFAATVLFMLSRLFILLTIYQRLKSLNPIPVIIGSIPFSFLFTYLIYLVYTDIYGLTVIVVLLQSLIISIIGGFALGNYVMKNDEPSKYLLVSSLFFALNVFALGIKYYYLDLVFLKPVAMVFFLSGHFIFLRFVIILEKEENALIGSK